MATKVDFDGENRYVVLKPGFDSIDVQIDIYSDWKEWWLMGDNSKYAAAFRTFGGDETSESQFAPRYFFLINGWKLYASGVNTSIQTNIYSDDGLSPVVYDPTETSAVSIRNSDVPVVKSELEKRLDYGDRIYYDENSIYDDTTYPNGTIAQPVNNPLAAIALGQEYNINKIICLSDINIQTSTGYSGYTFENWIIETGRENLVATIYDNTLVSMLFNGFTVLDVDFGGGGVNKIVDCTITNALNFSGEILNSTFAGTLLIDDEVVAANCRSGIPGSGAPIFDMNPGNETKFSLRAYSGGVDLRNCDTANSVSTLELIAGQVIFDSSCSDGNVDLRGVGYKTDNSTGTIIKTLGFIDSFEEFKREQEINAYGNKIFIDPVDGFDGTTYPIGTAAAPSNSVLNTFILSNSTNIKNIHVRNSLTLENLLFQIDEFNAYSDTSRVPLYVNNSGSLIKKVYVNGFDIIYADFEGEEHDFERCILRRLDGAAGHFMRCDIDGGRDTGDPSPAPYINVLGNTTFVSCHPLHAGDPPTVNLVNPSGTRCSFRQWNGDLIVGSVAHADDSLIIETSGAKILITDQCTAGRIEIRGICEVIDNSGPNCVVKKDAQLQASPFEYNGQIVYDAVNGKAGTIYPVGTFSEPVNNITDALTLLNDYKLNKIFILGSLEVNGGEDLSGITFASPRSTGNYLTITDAITNFTYVENLTCLNIIQNGSMRYTTSVLVNIENFDGGAKDCLLVSDFNIVGTGSNYFTNCDRYISETSDTTEFNVGDKKLNLIRCRGKYKITNKTGTNTITADLVAGTLIVDSTCVAGTIGLNGIIDVEDNSSPGCLVVQKALSNDKISNTVWSEDITVYSDPKSAGNVLYNAGGGSSPALIAEAVWEFNVSGINIDKSAGFLLRKVTGMVQENYRITNQTYDGNGLLTAALIKLYDSASDANTQTNEFATYSVSATYNGDGLLTDYKVIEV